MASGVACPGAGGPRRNLNISKERARRLRSLMRHYRDLLQLDMSADEVVQMLIDRDIDALGHHYQRGADLALLGEQEAG